MILAIVTVSVLAWSALTRLDSRIQHVFDGPKWSIPARVYARPLELYQGLEISQQAVVDELVALGYRDNPLTGPGQYKLCLLYTSPSPRDATLSRMPSSA